MFEDDFYDRLARYYDLFQNDLEPDKFAGQVHDIIERYCTAEGDGEGGRRILCDLGCGNGRVDVEFDSMGYEVIGIDSSFEMLDVARSKGENILWLCQDITEFELYGSADVFVSLLDTINHILDIEDIRSIFALFKNYLNVGGVFVFDIATYKHFAETLGNQVFFEDYDDVTLLWDNTFDEEEGINEASLTLFEREEDGRYVRSDGVIEEQYYDKETLIGIGEEFGLKFMAEVPCDKERTFLVFKRETL